MAGYAKQTIPEDDGMLKHYQQEIVSALEGRSDGLAGVSASRLDWSGLSVVLRLYDRATGDDRNHIIGALGQIIDEATAPPKVVAQVIHLAASLDITQVEPNIVRLQAKSIAMQEPVNSAIANYFAYRQVRQYQ